MAQKCDLCGKGPQFGNNISHAHNTTRRRWNVNLQPGQGQGRRRQQAHSRLHQLHQDRQDRQRLSSARLYRKKSPQPHHRGWGFSCFSSICPFCSLLLLLKPQRSAVDAIAHPRRLRTVRERHAPGALRTWRRSPRSAASPSDRLRAPRSRPATPAARSSASRFPTRTSCPR